MPDPAVPAPQAGWLLVALPTLEDPNFHRTVVLLLACGDEGAVGVVLNRPNEVPVGVLFPQWERITAQPPTMFVGGPVERSSVIAVGRLWPTATDGFPGCQPFAPGLSTVDLNLAPDDVVPGVEHVRLFSGYAGWGRAQLDGEILSGSWLVIPSLVDDVFAEDPETLWTRVLRRQGGRAALYAKAPPKLSLN